MNGIGRGLGFHHTQTQNVKTEAALQAKDGNGKSDNKKPLVGAVWSEDDPNAHGHVRVGDVIITTDGAFRVEEVFDDGGWRVGENPTNITGDDFERGRGTYRPKK